MAILVCAATTTLGAQSFKPDSFKQNVTAAFVHETKAGPDTTISGTNEFSTTYWFRPVPWLALETGYEQIVRPLGSSVCCEYSRNADDQLYLVPFGVRYIWEPQTGRLRITLGGGGAYLNHTVGNHGGGIYGFSGLGGQFVGSADYAVTQSGRFRIGATARYYSFSSGPSLALGVPYYTAATFHAFVFGPEFSFSFR